MMIGTTIQNNTMALEKMEGKIDDLPLLPQALVKLLQLDRTSDCYFDEFESLVKEDPTFAVRVVALANSASSAPVSPVVSIRDAITRMGAATISNLVASLSVQRVFMPTKPGEKKLWTHSVYAANATQQIAKITPSLEVEPEQAYLAGLLHDIGRFVMLEHASDKLLAVDESNWRTPGELVAADVDIYKYTHSELGYLACHRWGIPDAICDVVRAHHGDPSPAIQPGSVEASTYCVQVADRLSMFILECDNEYEADEMLALINDHCIVEIDEDYRPDALKIFEKIPGIRDSSNSLLAGMGLNR